MSALRCSHGINPEVEPCYFCDVDELPAVEREPDLVELVCAGDGHPFYKDDLRCYCGFRDERANSDTPDTPKGERDGD